MTADTHGSVLQGRWVAEGPAPDHPSEGHVRVTKLHGLGNDFLVAVATGIDATPELARAWCDRRRGIGADGLITIDASPEPGADLVMVLHNADGSRAEMSGNGIRCAAHAAWRAGLADGDLRILTDAGLRVVRGPRPGPDPVTVTCAVDMGTVHVVGEQPEWVEGDVLRAARVDAGNPHLVLHTDDLDGVDIGAAGAHLAGFVPGGINVEFFAVAGPGELEMLVWERGVGPTEACGTGACAVAVAARRWGLAPREVTVRMPGGEVRVTCGPDVVLEGPSTWIADAVVPVPVPTPSGGGR